MKHKLAVLSLLALGLACTQEKSVKSSSSSSSDYCTLYPTSGVCAGVGTATSGTSSGTTSGSSTGSTTSGSSSGGSSSYTTTIPSDNNWADLYASTPVSSFPEKNCGTSGTGYPLRTGTITLSGATLFTPNNNWSLLNPGNVYTTSTSAKEVPYTTSAYSQNISSYFTDVFSMRDFLDSDALRKVRFKIKPQVKPTTGVSTCYYRRTGQSADTYGYTKLSLTVAARPVNADGSLGGIIRSWTVGANLNACTDPIDMSADVVGTHPYGIIFEITQVTRGDYCWYAAGCTTTEVIKDKSCWQVDVQAAVDGTVTF